MMRGRQIFRDRPWLAPTLASVVLVILGLVLLAMSTSGRALFDFSDDAPRGLAADENIRLWVEFDKPSYLIGDTAIYKVRIVWRDKLVTPDIKTFETSISFFPFDHLGGVVDSRRVGNGFREYSAGYLLQAVNVSATTSYQLDTATVFYTMASDGNTDVHAFRASPPPIHIGEFYPDNIARIALRPPKPSIDDARSLRRWSMAACGAALAVVLSLLLRQRARKRPYTELSAAERLWRDFDGLRRKPHRDQQRGVEYERLFTQALELRAGIRPLKFWSDQKNELNEFQDIVVEARNTFGETYRPAGPSDDDIESMAAIVDKILVPMVTEERLQREVHDNFWQRLQRQPRVLAASAALSLAVLTAFSLAALPSLWLPQEIKRYNAAVTMLGSGDDLQQAVNAFSELGELSKDARVRSASLYNFGTLLADPRLTRLSREQHQNFLAAIFLPEVTLNRLLHDLELDAEFELITLLSEITRQYVQAEQALKASVRVVPKDPDTRRNLEILGKLRKAIGRSLAQLVRQGEDSTGVEQMLSQTIIDLKLLMESELPDDYAKIDEGKDDRDYFIMERF